MNRSARSSLDDSHDEVSFHSPLEVTPCRRTEWPVVRLDNVPWSITADEVEQWLPDGSLASDAGFSPGIVATGEVESVTLAVHILCNRYVTRVSAFDSAPDLFLLESTVETGERSIKLLSSAHLSKPQEQSFVSEMVRGYEVDLYMSLCPLRASF